MPNGKKAVGLLLDCCFYSEEAPLWWKNHIQAYKSHIQFKYVCATVGLSVVCEWQSIFETMFMCVCTRHLLCQ